VEPLNNCCIEVDTVDVEYYMELKRRVLESAYARDIEWSDTVGECPHPDAFFTEYAFVVCNAGMREQIARQIFIKVIRAKRESLRIRVVRWRAHPGQSIENGDLYNWLSDSTNSLLSLRDAGVDNEPHIPLVGGEECAPACAQHLGVVVPATDLQMRCTKRVHAQLRQ
jgi:hypothetical protein